MAVSRQLTQLWLLMVASVGFAPPSLVYVVRTSQTLGRLFLGKILAAPARTTVPRIAWRSSPRVRSRASGIWLPR